MGLLLLGVAVGLVLLGERQWVLVRFCEEENGVFVLIEVRPF